MDTHETCRLWLTRPLDWSQVTTNCGAGATIFPCAYTSPRPGIIITFSRRETSIFLSDFFPLSVPHKTRFTPLWIIANNLHWPARGEREREREDRWGWTSPSSFLSLFLQLFLRQAVFISQALEQDYTRLWFFNFSLLLYVYFHRFIKRKRAHVCFKSQLPPSNLFKVFDSMDLNSRFLLLSEKTKQAK